MQRCWEGEDTRLGRIVSIRKPILSWSYTGVNKVVRCGSAFKKGQGKKRRNTSAFTCRASLSAATPFRWSRFGRSLGRRWRQLPVGTALGLSPLRGR